MYRGGLRCRVIGIPNTGLDPALFCPVTPSSDRPVDLGYRADEPAPYIGHTERRDIADYFRDRAEALQLRVDISLDPRCRLAGAEWARFLDRCKGQLGTEAGGDFFELTDATRNAVNAFTASHPDACFSDIWDRFFRNYENPVPIRIISGRNVEAAATKTVQLLFEGEYDGYLRPDEHYIPLKKDFTNVDDALRKFRDAAYCERVTGNAYNLAMSEFTYDRLIDRFIGAIETV